MPNWEPLSALPSFKIFMIIHTNSEGDPTMVELYFKLNPKLHAHTSGHWRAKAAATKKERDFAAKTVSSLPVDSIKGKAVVDYRFVVPNRIRRDTANMIQSCKPLIDGVCDAGLIEGDHWAALSIGKIEVELGEELGVFLTFSKDKTA